jgi:hypothetical protein
MDGMAMVRNNDGSYSVYRWDSWTCQLDTTADNLKDAKRAMWLAFIDGDWCISPRATFSFYRYAM